MEKIKSESLNVKSFIISGVIVAVGIIQVVMVFQNAGLLEY